MSFKIIILLGSLALMGVSNADEIKMGSSKAITFDSLAAPRETQVLGHNMNPAMINNVQAAIQLSLTRYDDPMDRVYYIGSTLVGLYPNKRWNVVEQYDAILYYYVDYAEVLAYYNSRNILFLVYTN
nr:uncharacterized protein LOC111422905 [Onthophagus taurus]